MPAHEELVVGRKDAAVEHLERGLEQGWAGALQNHGPLLRKGGGYAALVRAARQGQLHEGVSPNGVGRTESRDCACGLKEAAAAQADRGERGHDVAFLLEQAPIDRNRLSAA